MPRFVFPQIIPEFLVFRQSLVERKSIRNIFSYYCGTVDCKINPNAVRTKKDQLPLKWCLPQTHLLGADLLSSITYSERIKIETFCELGLSNIQMGVRLNRSPSTIS